MPPVRPPQVEAEGKAQFGGDWWRVGKMGQRQDDPDQRGKEETFPTASLGGPFPGDQSQS